MHPSEAISQFYDDVQGGLMRVRRLRRSLDTLTESFPEVSTLSRELSDLVDSAIQAFDELADKAGDGLELLRAAHRRHGEAPLDAEALERLNDRARLLHQFVRDEAAVEEPRLKRRVADPDDPLADYEIEVKLDFVLRETDPEYSEKSDNILTSRDEPLKDVRSDPTENDDDVFPIPPLEPLGIRPCWLFHDLVDHSYGPDQPRLMPSEVSRVGQVWVEVQIRQQYFLDVDSGRWRKFDQD